MTTVRTRFSPSPTGMIHLGNARAALYSALFATKNAGHFVLRIEDTDAARSEERYTEALQIDLNWLGVEWQEGPTTANSFGPYRQSQRQDIYAHFYQILEEKKLIYPCFCTDQELLLARKIQLSRGQPPRYAGTCKKLSAEEIANRIANGTKPAWRFIVPQNQVVNFVDLVKGPQQFKTDDIGDFIIRRADGTAPFLFCNAIDDAKMEITHVLRGEDHLANTPRQILLLETLNLSIPQYGHLSLIVGDDGSPLSKRHGSFSLHEMRAKGYLPIAIINYLTRLGHTCDAQELLPFDLLASHFYLEKLSRSPARFDQVQLNYWQKLAVQKLDEEGIWQWLGADVQNLIPSEKQSLFAKMVLANNEFPHEAAEWAMIFFAPAFEINEDDRKILAEAGAQFFQVVNEAIAKHGIDLPAVFNEMKTTLGVSGKKLFMPLRIALTGRASGPEMVQIAELLGLDKIKARLTEAESIAKANERV